MSDASGELRRLSGNNRTDPSSVAVLPDGAYRANLYVYDPFGRIDWYALVPQSFAQGAYFTIGRGSDCNITLNDTSVSTRHASVVASDGQLWLRDLGSTNGTLLNGEPIEESVLIHGDLVQIGATDVRFLYSYRDSPVHLVLDFISGPRAGVSVATSGASTSVGRLNCAINLAGTGVAAQHVRVDAFGHELLYVVNLNPGNDTWLNNDRLVHIATAREGDVIRVGEHEIALRVLEDTELADAVPQQDGTLLLSVPPTKAADVAMISSTDLARLEAHLQDLPAMGGGDATAYDLQPVTDDLLGGAAGPGRSSGGHARLPARPSGDGAVRPGLLPRDAMRPERRSDRAAVGRSPSARGRLPESGPSGRRGAVDWTDDAPPARRPRGSLIRWLLLPGLLGGLAAGAALVPIPQSIVLPGRLSAGAEGPIVSTVRGRLEQVYFAAGETVVAGDVVVHLHDLAVQSELDQLTATIEALERDLGAQAVPFTGQVPSALRRALAEAETAADSARDSVRSMLAAFNRREATLEKLDAARDQEAAARRAVIDLRAQVEAERGRTRVRHEAPSDERVAEMGRLVARKEQLRARLRVPITAGRAGALVAGGPEPPRVGQVVNVGERLFTVMEIDRLKLELTVPGSHLGAVEAAGEAEMIPEGYQDAPLRLPLGRVGPAANADGSFPLVSEIENSDGRLRPGQRVEARVDLPSTSALAWVWSRINR